MEASSILTDKTQHGSNKWVRHRYKQPKNNPRNDSDELDAPTNLRNVSSRGSRKHRSSRDRHTSSCASAVCSHASNLTLRLAMNFLSKLKNDLQARHVNSSMTTGTHTCMARKKEKEKKNGLFGRQVGLEVVSNMQ